MYFRASADAELGLGWAGSNLNEVFSAQLKKKVAENSHCANCMAETPANGVQWVCWVISPWSIHTILIMKENCIMKVEFSHRNYALFSRYSRVKVQIANPDSNLATLNRAAERCRSVGAFNGNSPLLSPESRNRDRKRSVVVEIIEKYCAHVQHEERGEQRSKLASRIRAAECFRPL